MQGHTCSELTPKLPRICSLGVKSHFYQLAFKIMKRNTVQEEQEPTFSSSSHCPGGAGRVGAGFKHGAFPGHVQQSELPLQGRGAVSAEGGADLESRAISSVCPSPGADSHRGALQSSPHRGKVLGALGSFLCLQHLSKAVRARSVEFPPSSLPFLPSCSPHSLLHSQRQGLPLHPPSSVL